VAACASPVAFCGCQPARPSAYTEDPARIRQREIRALEKLRDEAIEDAKRDGKPEAEIEKIREKFRAEIERLSGEGDAAAGKDRPAEPPP